MLRHTPSRVRADRPRDERGGARGDRHDGGGINATADAVSVLQLGFLPLLALGIRLDLLQRGYIRI